MATQYFLIIIGLQVQWLEFHIKIQGLAGKQCAFSDHKAGKGSFFLKLGLEFQLQLNGHPVGRQILYLHYGNSAKETEVFTQAAANIIFFRSQQCLML